MNRYPEENWKRLGKWVATARRAGGYTDTKTWADRVGRSSRMLLGLERGEPVGDGTLNSIAAALGVENGVLYIQLAGDPVGGSAQDASYVAAPGPLAAPGITNEDLMREILRSRAEYDQLRAGQDELAESLREVSQRVSRLESPS